MLCCVFLSKVILDKNSGKGIWITIVDVMIFQIDLALSIMNYGIDLQWDGASAKRPNFMRQDPFVPCDCGKCFFRLNRITTGIAYPPSKKAKVTVE
jgi:hypothetical protein